MSSKSSENFQGGRLEESLSERGVDHPSVRAILRFSERFLPNDQRGHVALSHVGNSTIVTAYFIGSRGGPGDATFLTLGVVAPDGTPFGLFNPLPLADEPPVVAHSDNPESPLVDLPDVVRAELREMGLRPI